MAKNPSSKKKSTKAGKAKVDKYGEAIEALESVGADKQEFGQLNADGTVNIDPEKLKEFKEKLGDENWSKVRFVALNAPFKRRSPIPPA